MNELAIECEGGAGSFEPGQVLRGKIRWSLEEPPPRIELRLCWRSSGEVSPEEVGALRLDWGDVQASGQQDFELPLPHAPVSAVGRFFRLDWLLQLQVPGRDLRHEHGIVIAPGRVAPDWSQQEAPAGPADLVEDRLDLDQAFGEEAVVMRTRRRTVWRLALQFALLALAWNGAWACFAFGLGPFDQPAPMAAWVLLFPLGLLGLLWILLAGSAVLVAVGPDPSLILNQPSMAPGSRVPLGWSVDPGRRPFQPWQLTLEGREEVETRVAGAKGRGERCFYRALVHLCEQPGAGNEGAVRVRLPRDLVPSFESRSIALRWHLRFARVEPRRKWSDLPGMDQEFEVQLGVPSPGPGGGMPPG